MDNAMELMRGTVDLMILRALAWTPMHGYGLSQWIRERTNGVLQMQDAALYQALRRLEQKKLVKAEWGLSETNRRARFYTLTAAGRKQFQAESNAWARYSDAVSAVLAPVDGEAT